MERDSEIIRVVPTQGHDYKNMKDALSDWKDNKDFRIVWGEHSGKAINKEEADKFGITIQIRYWRKSRLTEPILPNSDGLL